MHSAVKKRSRLLRKQRTVTSGVFVRQQAAHVKLTGAAHFLESKQKRAYLWCDCTLVT